MENNNVQKTFEGRMAWRKPQIQKLTINLDTQLFTQALQSTIDFVAEG